jgi:oligoendopeptidase F
MSENNADEELIIIQNLESSLDRVKAMVALLYNQNTLTFEVVEKIARIAKFKLKQVSEEPKETELAFTSLEEVVNYLINRIL